jgi:alanine-glyoxylate transaminase/serine-glyoxylate transaminase/serine-pyruvate transaminase
MSVRRGWNFLMTPGPTNIPERVQAAMNRPALEYAGPDFVEMSLEVHNDIKKLFRTDSEVFIYSANGHGAWEAALSNTISPGDTVLVPGTGQFSVGWSDMAESLGAKTIYLENDWRHGIDPAEIEQKLRDDKDHDIKAVLMVHTDTASSITSDIPAIRKAIDAAGHPALLMVDTIASLVTTEYCMDEWGVDVTIAACQKGVMMPPGISFTAANDKARKVGETASHGRNYWDWRSRRGKIHYTWYCGTGPVNMIFGLREAIDMILEETLDGAIARHQRLADAVRSAVGVWGQAGTMELNAKVPEQMANGVTTIRVSEDFDVSALQSLLREQFSVALGSGLGALNGKSYRIGHMGYVNEPMILGTLASIETAFGMLGIDHGRGGVMAAIDSLARSKV